MAYQFFHIETYSEAPRKVRGTKDHYNTAAQVLDEARRTPAASEHVAKPLPPVQLPGSMPIDDFIALRRKLLDGISETVTSGETTYRRRLRADAATLYTEIHSHPIRSADYLANPGAHLPEITRWLQLLDRDFRRRMPKGIAFSAVMHLDEAHVHVHILAINALDPKLDANKLHAGKRAAAEYRVANGSDAIASLPEPELLPRPKKPKKPRPSKNRQTQKKNEASHAAQLAEWEAACAPIDAENAQRLDGWKAENAAHLKAGRDARGTNGATKAYTAAMKTVQDDYFEAVGKPCGLLRHGPRKTRKSTKEYAAEKRQARQISEDMAAHERQRVELARAEREARAAFAERESAVQAAETALVRSQEEHKAEVAAQAEALAARESALDEKERELHSRDAELTDAIDAMGQVLDAVENGEAELTRGKLRLPSLPRFLRRLQETPPPNRTPLQKLVNRFTSLLRRAVATHGSGPEQQPGEPEDRPSM